MTSPSSTVAIDSDVPALVGRFLTLNPPIAPGWNSTSVIGDPIATLRGIADNSASGLTGSRVTVPGRPSAWSMAEAIAAPAAVMPPSPAPLTPSGLRGLEPPRTTEPTAGISDAVGRR